MAILTPCKIPMELLERWPSDRDMLSTNEIITISGGVCQPAVYRWMTRLSVFGYFTRHPVLRSRGRMLMHWTITPKGREAILELRNIHDRSPA